MVPQEFRGMELAPVVIGKHVIIGSGTVILPGVILPIGVSVGAMSLVIHTLKPWSVNAGIPAKFIKARSKELLKYEELIGHKSADRDD